MLTEFAVFLGHSRVDRGAPGLRSCAERLEFTAAADDHLLLAIQQVDVVLDALTAFSAAVTSGASV